MKKTMDDIYIFGMPEDLPEKDAAVFRSRILHAYGEMLPHFPADARITVGPNIPTSSKSKRAHAKDDEDTKATQYTPVEPQYSFDQLILPEKLKESIRTSIKIMEMEELVFDQWGLRQIEPNPKSALNFHGKPGTGKTMAAHAIAQYVGKKILIASYAEIESKYHGDGPKNVKALFKAAEAEGAILFIDEADSLLSRRLTNVTQGSEQAINSMRSQLLINLEMFRGIAIFSTNLVENYDKAFETRITHIEFPLPDADARKAIWRVHLPQTLPLADDVSIEQLAEAIDDVCGRDIKNTVIRSALDAAVSGKLIITHDDLVQKVNAIKADRVTEKPKATPVPLSEKEKKALERQLGKAFNPDKKKRR